MYAKDSRLVGTFSIHVGVFLLGMVLVAAGGYKLYGYCEYRFQGVTAYGIVDHPSSGKGLGGRPPIRYTDAAGDVHEFKTRAKTHWFFRPEKGKESKFSSTKMIREK